MPCTTAPTERDGAGDVDDEHDRAAGRARRRVRWRRSRAVPTRPSYRPITPSTTATSAPASAVQQQRDDAVLADQVRVEVAPGPAAGKRVVAGVDVVGADLVAADHVAAAGERGHQAGGDRRLALAGGRGGDDDARERAHHSMPRWPFCPASIGCLTLVISVTRSATSTRRGSARRPVITTYWRPGRFAQRLDDVVDVDPAPLHRVGELVEHVEVVGLLGQPALDLGPALGGLGRVVGLLALPCATTTSRRPSCATRRARPRRSPGAARRAARARSARRCATWRTSRTGRHRRSSPGSSRGAPARRRRSTSPCRRRCGPSAAAGCGAGGW